MAVAETIAVVAAGGCCERIPADHVYGILYAICGVGCTVSIALFWFIADPAEHEDDESPPRGRALLQRFVTSLRDRNFRAVLVARILANAGQCALPFVVLSHASVRGGGLSTAALVSCAIGLPAGRAVSVLAFGRLADRFGNRLSSMWGVGFQFAALLTALTFGRERADAPSPTACSACYRPRQRRILPGARNLSARQPSRPPVIANLGLGSSPLAVPVCGGLIAQHLGVGAYSLFAIGLTASALSLVPTLLAVREPRAVARGHLAMASGGHVPAGEG